LDQLTVPLIGCDQHREQFTSVCGLTTESTADLLNHRPAGGINCPSCHLAPHNPGHPMIPVTGGAVAVLACPQHQAEIVDRFRTGLETQQQLTSSLNTLQQVSGNRNSKQVSHWFAFLKG
jgi:hypothetical protein